MENTVIIATIVSNPSCLAVIWFASVLDSILAIEMVQNVFTFMFSSRLWKWTLIFITHTHTLSLCVSPAVQTNYEKCHFCRGRKVSTISQIGLQFTQFHEQTHKSWHSFMFLSLTEGCLRSIFSNDGYNQHLRMNCYNSCADLFMCQRIFDLVGALSNLCNMHAIGIRIDFKLIPFFRQFFPRKKKKT